MDPHDNLYSICPHHHHGPAHIRCSDGSQAINAQLTYLVIEHYFDTKTSKLVFNQKDFTSVIQCHLAVCQW